MSQVRLGINSRIFISTVRVYFFATATKMAAQSRDDANATATSCLQKILRTISSELILNEQFLRKNSFLSLTLLPHDFADRYTQAIIQPDLFYRSSSHSISYLMLEKSPSSYRLPRRGGVDRQPIIGIFCYCKISASIVQYRNLQK